MRNTLSARPESTRTSLSDRLLMSASAVALTLGMATLTTAAQAQTSNTPTLDIEEIVVRGAALSQQRAIERKRMADTILDAVSADDLGKLPDKNLTEAIDRLPGISISNDQGEGRFVSIRGASPNLNSVTINGLAIGSVEENSRQVPLDIIGSELLGGVEVIKAVTPDLEANAIGGYINVLSASPFDYDRAFFVIGSAQIGDEEQSTTNPWAADLTVGGTFGSNQSIGVMAGVSYSWRDYNTKGLYVDDWRDVDGIPRGLPESHKFNDYDLKRKRLGFNGSVEIKPDDESLYYLRAVYSKFDEDETRYRNRNYFGERENNNTLTGSNVGIYDNQRIRNELRFEEKDKRISNYSIGGENTVDQYKFTYDANLIDNNTTEPNTSWAFRSGRIFSGTFDMGPELFEVRPNQAEVLSQLNLIPSEGVSFQDNNTDEDGYQAKGGVQYDFQADDYSGFVKTGVLYRSVERKQDLNGISYDDGPVGFNVGTPGITTGDTVEGTIQGQYYWAGAKLDLDGLRSFTDANLNNPGIFEFNAGDTLVDSTLGDFTVEEDVLSGYLMANVDIGDFKVIGGVRIEHTDVKAAGFDLLNETTVVGIDRDGSYTDYLPNIHVQYRPDDMPIVLRAAWTNTIGRPEFSDISPRRVTDREDNGDGTFTGSVQQGNPDLNAFESSNFDLSFEYYLGDTGLLSAAAFYKDISGFIIDQREVLTNTTFQGRDYAQLTVTTPINANDGEIKGIEFSYQDVWSFLPGPLSGLGGGASLTLVDSELNVDGRADKVPFSRQADTVYSLFMFYQIGDFEASIAYDWADDILVEVGGSADGDIYDLNYGRWDFKANYQITDNYGVFMEVQNINDAALGEYQGRTDYITRREIYGMTGYIGASFRF
ncbi:MAG: TonB-dependent receptor [Rhodospirillaceae bacterium]